MVDTSECTKTCNTCKHRIWYNMINMPEYCIDYEMGKYSKKNNCPNHAIKDDTEDEDDYYPSSTAGDYGPSNPWDAPGMSIKDFI